jgi:hypothetical protein
MLLYALSHLAGVRRLEGGRVTDDAAMGKGFGAHVEPKDRKAKPS